MSKQNKKKSNKKSKKNKKEQLRLTEHLKQVNLFAAGIDIGSEKHYVAIPKSLDEVSVRSFSCFTSDLEDMASWLSSVGITTVAMESTGVYWIPVYELLESKGFDVILTDAHHVKNVAGRKSDVSDCQWLQQLHTYGLLRGAFRPPEIISILRSYMRQRKTLVQYCTSHINHMEKALRQMNLLLGNVVNEITGKTGMAIIKSILSGERNPFVLSQHRDPRCKNSQEIIAKSLYGNYREEHLFALQQAVDLYEYYKEKIKECDKAIEKHLKSFDDNSNGKPLPNPNKKIRKKGAPDFNVRGELFKMVGVDLTAIPCISELSALGFVSEIGITMNHFKSEKQLSSWIGVVPNKNSSGKREKPSRTTRNKNKAACILRMAAYSLTHSKSYLGACYRRLKARLGPQKAITAMARKLACIIFKMIKYKKEFVELGMDYYEKNHEEKIIKNLKRKARKYGYELKNIENSEPVLSMT